MFVIVAPSPAAAATPALEAEEKILNVSKDCWLMLLQANG